MWWQVCALSGQTNDVHSVAFSADKERLVGGSADCVVKIWDTQTGAEVSTFWIEMSVVELFVCLEGGSGAWSWKWSEVTVLWQERTLTGHTGEVHSVAISRDGKRIVSGSEDNLVKIWDAATGAEVSSRGGCALCEAGIRFGLQGGEPRC